MQYITIPLLDEEGRSKFAAQLRRESTGCVIWTGRKTTNGYGKFYYKRVHYTAHRVAYVQDKGDIPAGMVLDHLCRNRSCVNPDHLEAVSQSVNVRRGLNVDLNPYKNVCPNGHAIEGSNKMPANHTSKRCRICYNAYMREYMRNYKPKSAILRREPPDQPMKRAG